MEMIAQFNSLLHTNIAQYHCEGQITFEMYSLYTCLLGYYLAGNLHKISMGRTTEIY